MALEELPQNSLHALVQLPCQRGWCPCPLRKATADAGVRALKCPCLSTQKGSMSTHPPSPSLSSPSSLPPPPVCAIGHFPDPRTQAQSWIT